MNDASTTSSTRDIALNDCSNARGSCEKPLTESLQDHGNSKYENDLSALTIENNHHENEDEDDGSCLKDTFLTNPLLTQAINNDSDDSYSENDSSLESQCADNNTKETDNMNGKSPNLQDEIKFQHKNRDFDASHQEFSDGQMKKFLLTRNTMKEAQNAPTSNLYTVKQKENNAKFLFLKNLTIINESIEHSMKRNDINRSPSDQSSFQSSDDCGEDKNMNVFSRSDNYNTLSLEERRKVNIARNEKFLVSLQIHKSKQELFMTKTNEKKPNIAPQVTDKQTTKKKKTIDDVKNLHRNLKTMQFSTHEQCYPYSTFSTDHHPNQMRITNSSSLLQYMNKKYPHRESQIQILYALFDTYICTSSSLLTTKEKNLINNTYTCHNTHTENRDNIKDIYKNNQYNNLRIDSTNLLKPRTRIPPAIFVTGPPSTGKTSIILDMIRQIKKREDFKASQTQNLLHDPTTLSPFGWAYVNCAMIGSSNKADSVAKYTLCDMLQNTIEQIWASLYLNKKHQNYDDNRRKTKSNPTNQKLVPKLEDIVKEKFTCSSGKNQHNMSISEKNEMDHTSTYKLKNKDAEINRRKDSCTESNVMNTKNYASFSSGPMSVDKLNNGALTLAFGRALLAITKPNHFQNFSVPCVLIIDRAERLLSLTSKPSHHNQFLSQLLLLPKNMGLNLWIIVVSSRSLLSLTRVSSLQGSIQNCLQPINIHFNAYKGKNVFKKILYTPKIKMNVIGSYPPSRNIDVIYDAMLDSLIPSLLDSSRDLGEMQRLAHILWPLYIQPLVKRWENFIKEDILSIEQQKLKHDLDKKARPWIQKLITTCLFDPGTTLNTNCKFLSSNTVKKRKIKSSWTSSYISKKKQRIINPKSMQLPPFLKDLPMIPRFLLLAGFLCQQNQSKTDLALFTNSAKGQRRNRNSSQQRPSDVYSENIKIKNIPFPLERMLSIFCSIIGQYGEYEIKSNFSIKEHFQRVKVSELGSAMLFSCLVQLSDYGLLRTTNKHTNKEEKNQLIYNNIILSNSSPKNTRLFKRRSKVESNSHINVARKSNNEGDISPKYCCTLSKEIAFLLASDLGFPLSDFMMS